MSENRDPDVKIRTTVEDFSNFIDAIGPVRDEGQILVTEEHIYSEVVDESTVQMCIARIPSGNIEEIDMKSTEEVLVGARFEVISDYLKGTPGSSPLELELPVERKGKNTLFMNIVDEDVQFYCPLLDSDAVPELPRKDPITCETRIKVEGSDLKKVTTHAKKVVSKDNGSLVLTTSGSQLEIAADDQVEGGFRKQFTAQMDNASDTLDEHKVEIAFRFLYDIRDVIGSSDEVTIHIREEYPLRLDVQFSDSDGTDIIYIIAPRIESD